MGIEIFDFATICGRGDRLKRVTLIYYPISQQLFSNPHNSGLQWTFWTFSLLKIIVWSLAFRWSQKFLHFGPICARDNCLKRGTVNKFWLIFSNPHNFGPERTFWTFSVLKMIVLSLAIQWTKKYFDFGLIYVCGSCSNRATIKAFQPILRHLFSNPHNFGLGWTFWTFSVLKMIVLSLAIWWAQKYFDFGLICAWVGCSNRVPIKADFAIFWGGVTSRRFYFGMLPTKCIH